MSTSVGAAAAASAVRQLRTRITLSRKGCANRPFYHIVVTRKGTIRGDALEQIGTFDPLVNKHNEKLVALNVDRLKHWLAQGAVPSSSAGQLLGLSGFLPIHPRTYLDSRRRRAAEAAKAAEETAKAAEEAAKAAEETAKVAEEAAKAAEETTKTAKKSESNESSVDRTIKNETDVTKDSNDKSDPKS